jgi:type II secretory pathway pseudopilin PulG
MLVIIVVVVVVVVVIIIIGLGIVVGGSSRATRAETAATATAAAAIATRGGEIDAGEKEASPDQGPGDNGGVSQRSVHEGGGCNGICARSYWRGDHRSKR